MSYHVEFTRSARKQIDNLPTGVAWAVLEFCAGPLADNPHRVGKPLIGEFAGLYSARRGEYRVIYAIHEERIVVEVAKVSHRARAYRP